MSEDLMLKCLIAFILGWFVCRQMGNGFSVGAGREQCKPLCRATVDHCKNVGDGGAEYCNMNRTENNDQACYWHDPTRGRDIVETI